jgi:DNA polymerase-3 subunit delta
VRGGNDICLLFPVFFLFVIPDLIRNPEGYLFFNQKVFPRRFMIIFISGADMFRAREKINELKKRFLEKNNGNGFLISEIEGADFDIAEFRNKILSAGFFAEKKFVIYKRQTLPEKKTTAKNKKTIDKSGQDEEILEVIKKIPEETILLVWQMGEPDEKSELIKHLLKEKYVYVFPALSQNELVDWIKNRVALYGIGIDANAIRLMIESLGNDLHKIDLELKKISCFVDAGATVDQKIIQQMLTRESEDNIFAFIDALAAKNKRLAMEYLQEELNAGVAELAILGAIARQIRIMLQIKALAERGRVDKELLARELSIHSFVAQKSLAQEKNFTANELKNIYRRLMQIDIAIKTGGASAEAMLQLLIAKL